MLSKYVSETLMPTCYVLISTYQNCSTGLTPQGKTPKTLVEEMVPLLDSHEVMYVISKRCPAAH